MPDQRGLVLIDFLFALVFLAFILTGTAALVFAQSYQHKQLLYTQYAMLVAEETATRIRRMRDLTGNIGFYLQHQWSDNIRHPNCMQQECSPAEFAAYDIAQLRTLVATNIPTGRIEVVQCGRFVCATVYWQQANSASACARQQCFRLRFF